MAGSIGATFVMADAPRSVSFSAFLLGLASATLVNLGAAPHPDTGAVQVDLKAARETIDLLEMLREKTAGNLTGEEEKLLATILTDVRFRYVEKSRLDA